MAEGDFLFYFNTHQATGGKAHPECEPDPHLNNTYNPDGIKGYFSILAKNIAKPMKIRPSDEFIAIHSYR